MTLDDLTVEELISAAEQATDLTDWGPDSSFKVGLGELVDSFNSHNLHRPELVERFRQQIAHLLETRLKLRDDEVKHPEILSIAIERPLIGVGLARTGTSILLDLIALDENLFTPREWEVENLCPAPDYSRSTPDPRIKEVQDKLDYLHAALPALRTMRPDPWAEGPADCLPLLNLHFASTHLIASYYIPEYASWLANNTVYGLYTTHRRALQQLAWKRPPGRWAFKEPMHQLNIDLVFETYPDACFVQTHRDPVQTLPSTASLIWTVLSLGHPDMDKIVVGKMVMEVFRAHLDRITSAREKNPKLDSQVLDLRYADTIKDPVGQCERIYSHFGMDFTDKHATAIREHIRLNPQGKHGQHEYNAQDFGMNEAALLDISKEYRERFGSYF